MSEEFKQKISKIHKAKIVSQETREKIRLSRLGYKVSDDTKKKLSQSLKGHSAWNKGISPSDETRQKMRLNHVDQTGQKRSEITRRNISQSLIGRKSWNEGKHLSQEIRLKISKSCFGKPGPWKNKKLSKEIRDKISKTRKEHNCIPWNKGRNNCYNDNTLRKMRLKHLERLKRLFPDGAIIRPNVGNKELEFVSELSKIISLDIKPQYSVDGYFVDCYIPEINLVIEFDEINGHTSNLHVENDKYRQLNIVNQLGCLFYRVDEREWDNNKEKVLLDVVSYIEQKIKEKVIC